MLVLLVIDILLSFIIVTCDRPVSIGETTGLDYLATFGELSRTHQYDESLHKFFTDTQLPPGMDIVLKQ